MFATSGRARVAYELTGDLGGAEVLLIHAGVNDRRSWRHVMARLAPRHRCLAYDMRGYGETTYEPEDGWSAVGDAVAVLDAAGFERAVVIACSMGGGAAIDLALAHPDRVAALALIGPSIRGAPEPEVAAAELDPLLEAAEESGDVDEIGRLEAWLWLDGPGAEEGRVGGATRALFLEMNDRALRAEEPGEPAETPPAWPRLGELAVPTLLLIGRLDVEEMQIVGEQAAAIIPGARLRLLDGVAHVPHLEGDPATLDELAAFVDAQAALKRAG